MADPKRAQPAVDLDPLTGRVVSLRELRDDDLPTLVRWWNDPSIAAYQRGYTQPRTAETITELIRGWSRNERADCGLSVVRRKGGELVGNVGLFGATPKDRCATFAVLIGPEHQNRGFGTEAARLMLRYAFVELGLHRVELSVYSFNPRAMSAYHKAGFTEEGRRRQCVWRSGAWHDDVTMGILYDEWLALPDGR